MVFGFKGFYPNETGVRKFLTKKETEALRCLWYIGNEGGSAKDIRKLMSKDGRTSSLVSINAVLRRLKEQGICDIKPSTVRTAPICYLPIVPEEEVPLHLVQRFLSVFNQAMPDEFEAAAKELGLL